MKVDLFPIKTSRDIVNVIINELDNDNGRPPNYAVLSIILGLVEAQLTSPANLKCRPDDSSLLDLATSDLNSDSKDDFILPHAITFTR